MKATHSITLNQRTALPALSENAWLRYFNFIALYIAQGIPEGMLFYGLPAWLAMHGKTPGEIGSIVAMAGLPWSFKIIVAPLMDRFTYLPMGRRRPWIIFGQLALVFSFAAMSFVPDPLNNLGLLMWAAFAVSCAGALQDVATDGMAVDVIPVNQQARANGFMWGAKIAGISASLAIGTWLLNKYGFQYAILSLSAMIGITMLVPIFFKERPGEKMLPWTKGEAAAESKNIQAGSWTTIIRSLGKVFLLRNSLFLAVMCFVTMAACNFLDTLLPIFTVQALGWTNEAYSQYYATASLVGGIGGMLIGGVLIDRFGKVRMLNIYFLLLVVLTAGFVFLKNYWANVVFISGFMMIYQVLYVFAVIGIFAAAMQCCWKKISATQFTLYMTIGNLGRVVGAKLIGPVKDQFNWELTLIAFAVFIALGWLLLQFLNIGQQEKKLHEINEADVQAINEGKVEGKKVNPF